MEGPAINMATVGGAEAFFKPGDFPCPIYCRTRDKTDEYNTRGREFMEVLWREYGKFLDPDALQRATQSMPAVFWELYLAYTLSKSCVSLQPQVRTKQNKKGPDLFAVNPEARIEAIMPGPGTGSDAMEYPPMDAVSETPINSFVLRLRHALETKARVMARYMGEGLIRPGQATVIAINSALLPYAINEVPVPRIVRAILGVGNQVLEIDRSTRQIVDHSVEHRDAVEKKSGTVIKTAPFLDQAYAHLSAVVYSASDWVNHPKSPGIDFTLIHNENAKVRLPHGWLGVGDEYWREADELHSRTVNPRGDDLRSRTDP
jgi:hypothetical protein